MLSFDIGILSEVDFSFYLVFMWQNKLAMVIELTKDSDDDEEVEVEDIASKRRRKMVHAVVGK